MAAPADRDAGIRPLVRSMLARGYSPDSSAYEGLFFGWLQNEFFPRRNLWGVSAGELAERPEAYLVHYRDHKIKGSLSWLSPMEYRRKLGYA